jgi:hypothetical protein
MIQRLLALGFIFLCTTIAWFILGAATLSRTHSSSASLRGKVASTWGGPHNQRTPEASWKDWETRRETTTENGKTITREKEVAVRRPIPLEATRASVGLRLEHRQKGLLWYSTYTVDFSSTYRFLNPTGQTRQVRFTMQYPAQKAVYDGLEMAVNGSPLPVETHDDRAWVEAALAGGQSAELRVKYRSQGLDQWSYAFGDKVAGARDFQLTARTNFADVDFPENTLSPTAKRSRGDGWELEWRYSNLLSGFPIAVAMPEKLQPGPLAGEISFFAPVSLFFYFFVLVLITTLRRIDVHPVNYFFIASAFFAFHLLFAYLADHISINAAFCISSLVSLALVASYLRLIVGRMFALREAALAQAVYLVLFSYAFFFKGYTGLSITIGAILTLFIAMQATATVKWRELF